MLNTSPVHGGQAIKVLNARCRDMRFAHRYCMRCFSLQGELMEGDNAYFCEELGS
jgi:hypothetical protein